MSCEDRGDTPSVCLQGTPFRQGGPNQYHTETEGGTVTITEYNVFPGIWLAFHEIRALSFSPPPDYPAGLLEISHCQLGRLEYQAGDRCFFLGIGDLSLHRSSCQSLFRCPTGRYTGLSVVIDPALAPWLHHLPVGGCGGGPNSPLPTVLRGRCALCPPGDAPVGTRFLRALCRTGGAAQGILEGKGAGTSALSLQSGSQSGARGGEQLHPGPGGTGGEGLRLPGDPPGPALHGRTVGSGLSRLPGASPAERETCLWQAALPMCPQL